MMIEPDPVFCSPFINVIELMEVRKTAGYNPDKKPIINIPTAANPQNAKLFSCKRLNSICTRFLKGIIKAWISVIANIKEIVVTISDSKINCIRNLQKADPVTFFIATSFALCDDLAVVKFT